jgi:hypothetical protein
MEYDIQDIFLDKPNLEVGSETFSSFSNTEKIWSSKVEKYFLRIIPVCAKLELAVHAIFVRALVGM